MLDGWMDGLMVGGYVGDGGAGEIWREIWCEICREISCEIWCENRCEIGRENLCEIGHEISREFFFRSPLTVQRKTNLTP